MRTREEMYGDWPQRIIPNYNYPAKTDATEARACFCVGPRPGQSRCPCKQRAYDAEKAAMRKEILDELGLSSGDGTGI